MSYINLSSKLLRTPSYRFTIDSLDDKDLVRLKEQVKATNLDRRQTTDSLFERFGKVIAPKQYKVRVRPRGPRNGKHYDTPMENATHFDVYVNQN